MRSRAAAVLLAALLWSSPAPAQSEGTLDPAFGSSGSRRIAFDLAGSTLDDAPAAVATQPDGRIVVAGAAQNGAWGIDGALARLDPSGNLDAGFGSGGRIVFGFAVDDPLTDVLVAPDGGLLVAGSRPSGVGPDPEIFVQRFTANGAISSSYAVSVALEPSAPAVRLALEPGSDRILVAFTQTWLATTWVTVIRLDPDLGRDTSYGFLGSLDILDPLEAPLTLADLAVADDGTLTVAGTYQGVLGGDFFVARADSGGTLEPGFGGEGMRVVAVDLASFGEDRAVALAVDPQGRALVAGHAIATGFDDPAAVLVRLTATGQIDASFNGGEPLVAADTEGDDSLNGIVVQSDGRLVVAGKVHGAASPMFFAARYLDDGSADWSFGSFGVFTANFPSSPNDDYAVALALDGGRPILVGPAEWNAPDYDFGVMRLNSALIFSDDLERGTSAGWSRTVP